MTIEEFLKNEDNNARLDLHGNWMYWNDVDTEWVVVTRRYKARQNTVLYSGLDLEEALEALKGE